MNVFTGGPLNCFLAVKARVAHEHVVRFADAIASDESIRITPSLRSKKGRKTRAHVCKEPVWCCMVDTVEMCNRLSVLRFKLATIVFDKQKCRALGVYKEAGVRLYQNSGRTHDKTAPKKLQWLF